MNVKVKMALGSAITLAGLGSTAYFCHKETEAEIKEKSENPDVVLVTVKDKAFWFGKHYWKTMVSMGVATGGLIFVNGSASKEMAVLAGTLGAIASQNEDFQNAARKVFGKEGMKKIAEVQQAEAKVKAEEAKKAPLKKKSIFGKTDVSDTLTLASPMIDVVDPQTGIKLHTSRERLMYADSQANLILQSTGVLHYLHYLELAGANKEELRDMYDDPQCDGLGWSTCDDAQNFNASYLTYGAVFVIHRLRINKDDNTLFLSFDLGPSYTEDLASSLVDDKVNFIDSIEELKVDDDENEP